MNKNLSNNIKKNLSVDTSKINNYIGDINYYV